MAAYYRANGTTLQVYDYSSNTAGFLASNCASGPQPQARTLERTVRLRSNRTQTYRLRLPQGFEPQGRARRSPTSSIRRSPRLRRRQLHPQSRRRPPPFLGATVVRDGFNDDFVFVRIRTARLVDGPVTLLISAHGTT